MLRRQNTEQSGPGFVGIKFCQEWYKKLHSQFPSIYDVN